MLNHNPHCVKAMANHNRLVIEYKKKYPNYCRTCNGFGGNIDTYDPSPSGVSLSPGVIYDFEPCPDCMEQGLCPQCKDVLIEVTPVEAFFCERCLKQEEDFEGIPEPPECFCVYEHENFFLTEYEQGEKAFSDGKDVTDNPYWMETSEYKQWEEGYIDQTFDLNCGCLGNGVSIWNRTKEVHGDYQKIAHIDRDRKIKYHIKNPTKKVKQYVEEIAKGKNFASSTTQPHMKVFNENGIH